MPAGTTVLRLVGLPASRKDCAKREGPVHCRRRRQVHRWAPANAKVSVYISTGRPEVLTAWTINLVRSSQLAARSSLERPCRPHYLLHPLQSFHPRAFHLVLVKPARCRAKSQESRTHVDLEQKQQQRCTSTSTSTSISSGGVSRVHVAFQISDSVARHVMT